MILDAPSLVVTCISQSTLQTSPNSVLGCLCTFNLPGELVNGRFKAHRQPVTEFGEVCKVDGLIHVTTKLGASKHHPAAPASASAVRLTADTKLPATQQAARHQASRLLNNCIEHGIQPNVELSLS